MKMICTVPVSEVRPPRHIRAPHHRPLFLNFKSSKSHSTNSLSSPPSTIVHIFSISFSCVTCACARGNNKEMCAHPTNVCPAGEPKPNWAVLLPGLPIGWEGPPGLPLGGNCPELVQYGGHSYTSRYLCVYRSPPPRTALLLFGTFSLLLFIQPLFSFMFWLI